MGVFHTSIQSPTHFSFPHRSPLPTSRPGDVTRTKTKRESAMPKPSRSDIRLYLRALRQGWNIPAKTRTEIVKMLAQIVIGEGASRRERTSAARALMQASRVELDAIRVAQLAQFENISMRLGALEGKTDGGLAEAAGEN